MCTLYHFPRHSGERAPAFAAPVAPIEEDVEADERKKREVGPDHPVVAVEDLVDDAEDIAELPSLPLHLSKKCRQRHWGPPKFATSFFENVHLTQ